MASWGPNKGLFCEDGAVFYMNPSNAPANKPGRTTEVVVAQVTVPASYTGTAMMNVAGKSLTGKDFHEFKLSFNLT